MARLLSCRQTVTMTETLGSREYHMLSNRSTTQRLLRRQHLQCHHANSFRDAIFRWASSSSVGLAQGAFAEALVQLQTYRDVLSDRLGNLRLECCRDRASHGSMENRRQARLPSRRVVWGSEAQSSRLQGRRQNLAFLQQQSRLSLQTASRS